MLIFGYFTVPLVVVVTDIAELVTDLDDDDVVILRTLAARLARPSGPGEEDRWPSRVQSFWHALCAGLDEETYRRKRMVQELRDSTGEGGIGRMVTEDDATNWSPDTGDAA